VFLNLTSFTIFLIDGLNIFIGFTGLETGYDARLTLPATATELVVEVRSESSHFAEAVEFQSGSKTRLVL
jgi:hypothetical protein